MSTTARVPVYVCPCGKSVDAATNVETGSDSIPVAGDVTACISCARIYMFREDLTLRPLTSQELRRMPRGVRKMLGVLMRAIHEIHHAVN